MAEEKRTRRRARTGGYGTWARMRFTAGRLGSTPSTAKRFRSIAPLSAVQPPLGPLARPRGPHHSAPSNGADEGHACQLGSCVKASGQSRSARVAQAVRRPASVNDGQLSSRPLSRPAGPGRNVGRRVSARRWGRPGTAEHGRGRSGTRPLRRGPQGSEDPPNERRRLDGADEAQPAPTSGTRQNARTSISNGSVRRPQVV
jgi:hypothetical protein